MLSFYFLLRAMKGKNLDEFYSKVLRGTINLGGCTEANTAIAGGMIGAIVGIRNIPIELLTVLLSFDCKNAGQKRDNAYSVRHNGLQSIEQLIECRAGKKLYA